MTKEEYENLKVGDIVIHKDKSILRITHPCNFDGRTRMNWILDTSEMLVDLFDDSAWYEFFSDCELLPLYNSPLYKAMNE